MLHITAAEFERTIFPFFCSLFSAFIHIQWLQCTIQLRGHFLWPRD